MKLRHLRCILALSLASCALPQLTPEQQAARKRQTGKAVVKAEGVALNFFARLLQFGVDQASGSLK